ncbi:putative retrotransposon gag domain-containing protein [Helianthus annuus]|nr:putative retrotransposon gag domain-containing protein [Helianthus annuus]
MDCRPTTFSGTEGAVGLLHWFEKLESVFEMCECPEARRVKYATGTLEGLALTWWNAQVQMLGLVAANATPWENFKEMIREEYCSRDDIHKLEDEFYNLKMSGSEIEAYTKRSHELALLCPTMVDPPYKRIELYLKGLVPEIQSHVTSANLTTIQQVVQLAHRLTDQAVEKNKLPKRIGTATTSGTSSGDKRKWDGTSSRGSTSVQTQSQQRKTDNWYLDNGASNHMTGNRAYFFELNERVTGKVKFGDGSCIDIRGKESVLLEGKTGEKRLLTDVYYIPSLQSNILSLGQATEGGCDIHMKRDLLTIHDDTGKLMMKVTRTKNRLYKINLKIASSGTQDNMTGIKNFAGRDLQRGELKDDTASTSQNLLKDPRLIKKPKIQSLKKNIQEFKEKVKQGIQTQGGIFNDPRKRVFAQDRSRVNGGASSYDQRTSRGKKTSRVQGRKNVRARKDVTTRNLEPFVVS